MRDLSLDDQPNQLPRNTFLVYGDTRCISGDAFIGYQVRTLENELQNSKGGSLARLFHRFHRLTFPGKGAYQRKQTVDSTFFAPSMTEDGRIFQGKIIDVVDSGLRECVRVRTVGGLELVCTPDHPIADESPFGFCAAADLLPGSTILVHRHVPWTTQSAREPRVNRPDIHVKHHPIAGCHTIHTSSGNYTYKRIRRSRAAYEAHMNGLSLEAYVARLNDGELDGLRFLSQDIEVHHRDENKLNDVPSNLIAMTTAEHSRHHFILPDGRPRCGSYMAVTDTIASIESAKTHQTFDIKMAGPDHNFVADGFIVHNSGKTVFGATFPRPLIIADVTEGGYESIKTMDRATWFEPNVKPIVKGVENMNDIAMLSPWIDEQVKTGRICSIIFDAFSFYCDFFLAGVIRAQTKPDNRQAYGSLGVHLRELRGSLHSKHCNVVWNCLARHPETDDPKGRPMIPGQQADKFAAGVDFLFHSRLAQIKENGKVTGEQYELRTRQFGSYLTGNRLGIKADQLPDPFVGTYSDLIVCLGYDLEALRKSMRPVIEPKSATPVAVVRPPIVISKPAPKVVSPQAINQPAPRGATK